MYLAGDIGGTKTVLAIFEPVGDGLSLVREDVYPSRGSATFNALLAKFLGAHRPVDGRIQAGCLGVAGAIIDGRALTTNLPWVLDEQGAARRLSAERVKLLNDLEAAAYGMLFLKPDELEVLQPNGTATTDQRGNIGVIAAGTGLGEAIMYWDSTPSPDRLGRGPRRLRPAHRPGDRPAPLAPRQAQRPRRLRRVYPVRGFTTSTSSSATVASTPNRPRWPTGSAPATRTRRSRSWPWPAKTPSPSLRSICSAGSTGPKPATWPCTAWRSAGCTSAEGSRPGSSPSSRRATSSRGSTRRDGSPTSFARSKSRSPSTPAPLGAAHYATRL